MRHGELRDMRHYYFLNSTCDIRDPRQGPYHCTGTGTCVHGVAGLPRDTSDQGQVSLISAAFDIDR